jgi:hypothetical protein
LTAFRAKTGMLMSTPAMEMNHCLHRFPLPREVWCGKACHFFRDRRRISRGGRFRSYCHGSRFACPRSNRFDSGQAFPKGAGSE